MGTSEHVPVTDIFQADVRIPIRKHALNMPSLQMVGIVWFWLFPLALLQMSWDTSQNLKRCLGHPSSTMKTPSING